MGRSMGGNVSPSMSLGGATTANGKASALISVGLFIAIMSAIVIVYQCGTWSSYSSHNGHSSKEKLYLPPPAALYQCPPPGGFNCSPKRAASLVAAAQDNYAYRSGLSTLALPNGSLMPQLVNRSKQQQQQQQQLGEPIYQLANGDPSGAMAAKEYETQMLKMSVLFDDINSLDEQNLNENMVSKNLN